VGVDGLIFLEGSFAMNVKKLTRALEDVQAWSSGDLKLKETFVVPPRVDVKHVRTHSGLSQKDFAARYGFNLGTLRNWEQGVREPEGPARTLLTLIERNPRLIERELSKISMSL
jgi:putative transcriptional regulator